jgi:GxxExxY protein
MGGIMGKRVKGPHEDITYRMNGAAMAVHRRLGPGHKENVYQQVLEAEFAEIGLSFEAQKNLEVYDKGRLVGYYIPDFIVEEKVIVEIKAFATLHSKYLGQVITYLNHTGLSVGLLINSGERSLRIRRVFPSPQATEFRVNHQWLFVPDGLAAEHDESV